MKEGLKLRYYLLSLLTSLSLLSVAQTVPAGIHYQAVARDNNGKELADKVIAVKFSIISGNPDGPVAYKEVHENIRTSKYGVFSLVIGNGVYSEGTATSFSEIVWEQSNHWLKVEVKFDNNYIDMGTMQFLAVPYALYAKKSLEPGPQGPIGNIGPQGAKGDQGVKGDQGDPATDNQKLGFDGTNLTISPNGNTVNLSTLNVPHNLTLAANKLAIYGGNDVDLSNYIQNISLDVNNKVRLTQSASEIDLSPYKQSLTYNNTSGLLSISNGTGADLTPLKNEVIQDLVIDYPNNKLKINKNAGATEVDLSKYLDNTDNQTLSYDSLKYELSVSGGNTIKMGRIIAFRAEKTNPAGSTGLEVPVVFDVIRYNEGSAYNNVTGEFTAPIDGIYTFNVRYDADLGAKVSIFLNGQPYEKIADAISNSGAVYRSITMKLSALNKVKVVVSTGIATQTGTGSFSGFRVY